VQLASVMLVVGLGDGGSTTSVCRGLCKSSELEGKARADEDQSVHDRGEFNMVRALL
jgi:hypothetical protein